MITPQMLAKSGTEDAEQSALFCWAAIAGKPELRLMLAIPNGGQRNAVTAARLKATGVKAGVPDILLPVARKGYHSLFIELKRKGSKKVSAKTGKLIIDKAEGKTQSNQDRWIADLRAEGHAVAVCVGWEEARDCLLQYLE